MKIHFPDTHLSQTPRLYLDFEVAALLVPLRYTERVVDYFIYDSRFTLQDTHPNFDRLAIKYGPYIDHAETFPIRHEKLLQLFLSGTLTVNMQHPVLTADSNSLKFDTQSAPESMIQAAAQRVIEGQAEFDAASSRFQPPKKGAYFVRLRYSEMCDAPNPELTHFAQFLDGAPVGIYRLIPGQPALFLPTFSPLEKEIVYLRQDDGAKQEEMDEDSRLLEQEILNTELALVNEHGIVFPREFRTPINWPDTPPGFWAYIHISNTHEHGLKTEVNFVEPDGVISRVATDSIYDDNHEQVKAKRNERLNEVTGRELRDHLVKISDRIGQMTQDGAKDLTAFSNLKLGEQFRLLFSPDTLFEKVEENRAFANHGLRPYHTFAGDVVVIRQESLDQPAPNQENTTPADHDPSDNYKLLLLEDIQTSRKVAALCTDDSNKKLGYLVSQSFGYNWTILKWNDIEPATAEILRDAGWPAYHLGKPYKDEFNDLQ